MNVLKRNISWLVIPAIAVIAYSFIIVTSPLPNDVIDRDHSGVISFGEAINSVDVSNRPSSHSPRCREYFWLKDGSTAYEQCSK